MTNRLKDKVALVFGAGSSGAGWGNGKATAVLFAREGARVIAVDNNRDAAEETRSIIAEEGGLSAVFAGDVTRAGDVAAIVGQVLAEFGRIDILHNNVGITDTGDLIELSEEIWHHVMDVNLTSVFLTCKYVLPVMKRQKKGAIINISSLAATQILDYQFFSYYASKAGVNHMTRALAVHYARYGIRANAIVPGLVNTPLIYRQISNHYRDTEEMIKARDAMSPTGRMGDAWDVANAAVFLASDEAGYINGVCLPVDGGLSCVTR